MTMQAAERMSIKIRMMLAMGHPDDSFRSESSRAPFLRVGPGEEGSRTTSRPPRGLAGLADGVICCTMTSCQ